jgi:predicted nucleotidyltransferase
MVAESAGKNIPEKQLAELVAKLREAAGENLQSVILYGSAASGEFHPEFSNLNLLCIVREISFPLLGSLSAPVKWWTQQEQAAPLFFTREELERSADVFAIEFFDMQRRHRVLFGDDVLSGLHIPMHLHKLQLEYELREKLILLRQHVLQAGDDKKELGELLLRSLPAFATLFRHTLIVMGKAAPDSKRAAVQALSADLGFDASPFLQVLDVREGKADRKKLDVPEVFRRYLSAVQQIVAAVDRMLEPDPGARI